MTLDLGPGTCSKTRRFCKRKESLLNHPGLMERWIWVHVTPLNHVSRRKRIESRFSNYATTSRGIFHTRGCKPKKCDQTRDLLSSRTTGKLFMLVFSSFVCHRPRQNCAVLPPSLAAARLDNGCRGIFWEFAGNLVDQIKIFPFLSVHPSLEILSARASIP